jgi:hypothetical protein
VRLLGAIGLVGLAILNAVGLVFALRNWDWKGIGLMLFLAMLLAYFARTLWRGRRLERGVEQGRLVDGWEGEPLSKFIASVVAGTLEGRFYIAGTVASELMAVLTWFVPGAVGISPVRAHGLALLFAVWPIIGFVLYIRICGPDYKTSALRVLFTLLVITVPFYMVYFRGAGV